MSPTVLPETLDTAIRLSVAGLVGLAVGIERQRSGHASGPGQHFAGTRTFLLIGLLGGLSGLFIAYDAKLAGAGLVFAGAALVVGAYIMTARRGTAEAIDGTTEVAALIVLALGALAGGGALRLSSGIAALVVLALAEKQVVHRWVGRLDPIEMRAALQFAVLALVVLPILPSTISTPVGTLTPRATWIFVLIISALNFAGHIARRLVGPAHGYALTGALGGMVSSTAVTLGFSRESAKHAALRVAYATGVVAACTVLLPRVLIVTTLLNRDVARWLWPLLLPAFVFGVLVSWWMSRRHTTSKPAGDAELHSPLGLASALQMAVAFQVVLLVLAYVRTRFGDAGIYTSAAVFGTTDVDALTIAMTHASTQVPASVAARAIGVGIASNTIVKLSLVLAIGRGGFRVRTSIALVVMFAVLVASLLLIP
jgi:uncharacterized membrane protein (DUF4010 family)